MSSIRVSAVIPAYRRPEAVKAAIASALAQTHPIHEVIVVDDASGDATPEAVRGVGDPRVRLIALETNVGQSAATNIGIDAATGDIVALLDSDDVWLPEKIERQLAAWAAHPRRDETLFASRVRVEVDGRTTGTAPDRVITAGQRVDDYLFVRSGLVQSSTLFMSRSLAARVRFDETSRRHSDLGFLLRHAARGGGVVQLPETLAVWRSQSGAARLSTSASLDSSRAWLETYRTMMSRRAVTAFRYRNHIRILRRTDPRAAALLTIRAAAAGLLGWPELRRAVGSVATRLRGSRA